MSCGIFWFRRDLRLADNPALVRAIDLHESLLLVFLDESSTAEDDASQAWLSRSIESLSLDIAQRGATLHVLKGQAEDILPRLAAEMGASMVHVGALNEPEADLRDARLAARLSKLGVRFLRGGGRVLTDADAVLSQAEAPYRVFTPFLKKALSTWRYVAHAAPARINGLPLPSEQSWPVCTLGQRNRGWDREFWMHVQPGESSAQIRLEKFLSRIKRYPVERDLPAIDATSRLSASLHFGEISAGRVLQSAQSVGGEGADKFIAEIGWREFAFYVLHHWPHSTHENFNTRFDAMPWRDDPAGLNAWKQGKTGVPLVDAGMRQLWHEGWMHNRVRMIAASWLTKHMGIDWREGAKWFMHTLVDADIASNTLGWQWVAGTGVDAAPYFRVFNPVTQSLKFDPSGDYLRRWLPELSALNNRAIHAPWTTGQRVAAYPSQPIVDIQSGRVDALHRFAQISR